MKLLGGGAINCMVYVPAVHASSHKRVCTGRAAFSFLLSEGIGNAKNMFGVGAAARSIAQGWFHMAPAAAACH